jgi:hypothetical protein
MEQPGRQIQPLVRFSRSEDPASGDRVRTFGFQQPACVLHRRQRNQGNGPFSNGRKDVTRQSHTHACKSQALLATRLSKATCKSRSPNDAGLSETLMHQWKHAGKPATVQGSQAHELNPASQPPASRPSPSCCQQSMRVHVHMKPCAPRRVGSTARQSPPQPPPVSQNQATKPIRQTNATLRASHLLGRIDWGTSYQCLQPLQPCLDRASDSTQSLRRAGGIARSSKNPPTPQRRPDCPDHSLSMHPLQFIPAHPVTLQ